MSQTFVLLCVIACVTSMVTADYYHHGSDFSNEIREVKNKIPLSVFVKRILQKINNENNKIEKQKEDATRRPKTKNPSLKFWPSFR